MFKYVQNLQKGTFDKPFGYVGSIYTNLISNTSFFRVDRCRYWTFTNLSFTTSHILSSPRLSALQLADDLASQLPTLELALDGDPALPGGWEVTTGRWGFIMG